MYFQVIITAKSIHQPIITYITRQSLQKDNKFGLIRMNNFYNDIFSCITTSPPFFYYLNCGETIPATSQVLV